MERLLGIEDKDEDGYAFKAVIINEDRDYELKLLLMLFKEINKQVSY